MGTRRNQLYFSTDFAHIFFSRELNTLLWREGYGNLECPLNTKCLNIIQRPYPPYYRSHLHIDKLGKKQTRFYLVILSHFEETLRVKLHPGVEDFELLPVENMLFLLHKLLPQLHPEEKRLDKERTR